VLLNRCADVRSLLADNTTDQHAEKIKIASKREDNMGRHTSKSKLRNYVGLLLVQS
jgi:hypothetical protein